MPFSEGIIDSLDILYDTLLHRVYPYLDDPKLAKERHIIWERIGNIAVDILYGSIPKEKINELDKTIDGLDLKPKKSVKLEDEKESLSSRTKKNFLRTDIIIPQSFG